MLHIGDWKLAVDVEKTRMALEWESYRCVSEECRNFMEACEKPLDQSIVDFAEELGIDLVKPSVLESLCVNDNTAVMYSGKYHLIGEIIEGELEAWDLMVGEFCFSLTDEMQHIPLVMDGSIIEISFEVVLPWLLESKIHV